MNDFRILVDEMKVRGFSMKTIKLYVHINNAFLDFIRKSPRDVSAKDIESYMVCLYDKNKSSATRHLYLSALKFYYESVLKRKFNLKYPKKSNKLPVVLTREEAVRTISSTKNKKHRLLLMLMYGSGLRVSEAICARIGDFDIARKILIVRSGKGGKDRIVNLPDRFIDEFLVLTNRKENGFLFEPNGRPNCHISPKTAQNVVKNSLEGCGISKKAHPHTFRTSYATHLIENGTDITYVQKLLGHANISTTQGYIRLSNNSIRNVKSPLD